MRYCKAGGHAFHQLSNVMVRFERKYNADLRQMPIGEMVNKLDDTDKKLLNRVLEGNMIQPRMTPVSLTKLEIEILLNTISEAQGQAMEPDSVWKLDIQLLKEKLREAHHAVTE